MERSGLMFILVVLLGLSAMGCTVAGTYGVKGSGNVRIEEHDVRDFNSVTFACIGELTIEQGEVEGLRIEAEDNLLPYFETEIHDGELIIRQSMGVALRPTQPVRFMLRVKSLEALAVSGSGDADMAELTAKQFTVRLTGSGDIGLGRVEVDALQVRLSGSGDIQIATLEADEIEANLTGSGDVNVGGMVHAQKVTISGSSSYLADALQSTSAELRLTGSGSAQVQVRERLEARLTGSGSVIYSGSPAVQSTITGSGRISAREG